LTAVSIDSGDLLFCDQALGVEIVLEAGLSWGHKDLYGSAEDVRVHATLYRVNTGLVVSLVREVDVMYEGATETEVLYRSDDEGRSWSRWKQEPGERAAWAQLGDVERR
jgi:photosystem II stability/assembly factor-like uncharacterized protein